MCLVSNSWLVLCSGGWYDRWSFWTSIACLYCQRRPSAVKAGSTGRNTDITSDNTTRTHARTPQEWIRYQRVSGTNTLNWRKQAWVRYHRWICKRWKEFDTQISLLSGMCHTAPEKDTTYNWKCFLVMHLCLSILCSSVNVFKVVNNLLSVATEEFSFRWFWGGGGKKKSPALYCFHIQWCCSIANTQLQPRASEYSGC